MLSQEIKHSVRWVINKKRFLQNRFFAELKSQENFTFSEMLRSCLDVWQPKSFYVCPFLFNAWFFSSRNSKNRYTDLYIVVCMYTWICKETFINAMQKH